jgi:hypothetical protein
MSCSTSGHIVTSLKLMSHHGRKNIVTYTARTVLVNNKKTSSRLRNYHYKTLWQFNSPFPILVWFVFREPQFCNHSWISDFTTCNQDYVTLPLSCKPFRFMHFMHDTYWDLGHWLAECMYWGMSIYIHATVAYYKWCKRDHFADARANKNPAAEQSLMRSASNLTA